MSSEAAIGLPAWPHYLQALRAIVRRDLYRFLRQTSRLISAVVRPTLWLVVFSAGFHDVLGVSIIPPYQTYITYQEYMLPGLIGITLLFNGMLSSLSLVYDRELGFMRLLLTAPLPRWYILLCKLIAGTALSVVQAYVFIGVAFLLGAQLPPTGLLTAFPAILLAGLMLGALGLLLSVYIRQLENFAGAMNFVVFPMFFVSSALFPLWKLQEAGSTALFWIAEANPFTHAVELMRFAAYGQFSGTDLAVVLATTVLAFVFAARGFEPSRLQRRRG